MATPFVPELSADHAKTYEQMVDYITSLLGVPKRIFKGRRTMTESEWLSSTDVAAMLEWALHAPSPPAPLRFISERKLRLFACACCYGVSAELGRDAEQLVEWNKAPADFPASWARAWAGEQIAPKQEKRAAILRDLVGNPFRPVVIAPVDRVILNEKPSWHTVLALVRAAYETKGDDGILDTDRLAVLADALEDEGCNDADLLGHLRGKGPHYRGCWAVDLLLGQE